MSARPRLPGFTNLPGEDKSPLARTLEQALIGRSSRVSAIVSLLAGAGLQSNQILSAGAAGSLRQRPLKSHSHVIIDDGSFAALRPLMPTASTGRSGSLCRGLHSDPLQPPSFLRSGHPPKSAIYELGFYEAAVSELFQPAMTGRRDWISSSALRGRCPLR